MPRFKHADATQTLMVPVRLADQLVPGTFERALNQIVDEHIDLSELAKRWFNNDRRGAPAFHPACLLKIVLLGYSKGLYSSRRIASARAGGTRCSWRSAGIPTHTSRPSRGS